MVDVIKLLSRRFQLVPLVQYGALLSGLGDRRVGAHDAGCGSADVRRARQALVDQRIAMKPAVAPGHPLALLGRPATRGDLEPYTQLMLSDPVDPGGTSSGLLSARLWRFVDLARRLDFMLSGLGWCRMPGHLVADGRLVALEIEDDPALPAG